MSAEHCSRPDPSCESQGQRQIHHVAKGFECLAAQLDSKLEPDAVHFEVVVVGSGYGGSVAASKLAACLEDSDHHGTLGTVCVLERGLEYLRGMFPSRLSDLPGHIRLSGGAGGTKGLRTALWDVRIGGDIYALVANGLGGGSLINAGVMVEPSDNVLSSSAWPNELRNDAAQLRQCFAEAKRCVGAVDADQRENRWADDGLAKVNVLQRLNRAKFVKPPITIALTNKASAGNVALRECVRCGDCASGCNHGAKESLDTNLLAVAAHHKASIYCGATVWKIQKSERGLWEVLVYHTDEKLQRRQGAPLMIRTRKLVLSAGTLGSCEILLRSHTPSLAFSKKLGARFSANGDMIAGLVGLDQEPRAVADEADAPRARNIGPTITGMIDLRDDDLASSIVIQDLAIPAPLRRLFEETIAVADTFDTLARGDGSRHSSQDDDPCAIDERTTRDALAVAIIGHDDSGGTIKLPASAKKSTHPSDGAVRIAWAGAERDSQLQLRRDRLATLQQRSGLGGRTLDNPMWRVLPAKLEFLFGGQRGPLLTVHPLGGCVMAENADGGVVNHLGQVFDPAGGLHEGLLVLDGSIIPRSLGINPSLTITALSLRAISELLRGPWSNYQRNDPQLGAPLPSQRPVFRLIDVDAAPGRARATMVEVVERLNGTLFRPRGKEPLYTDITLRYHPVALADLIKPKSNPLIVDAERSRVRVFSETAWKEAERRPDDERPDRSALFIAPVTGELRIFRREASAAGARRTRAGWAWFFNRGLRDTVQAAFPTSEDRAAMARDKLPRSGSGLRRICDRVLGTARLWSLAGEVRRFEYQLQLGTPTHGSGELPLRQGSRLFATKRFAYKCRGNPWRQLTRASLTSEELAGQCSGAAGSPATFAIDLRYLQRRGTALFRVVEQADAANALADILALGLYASRLMLRIHFWSFRKPDLPRNRKLERRPGKVPGLPDPVLVDVEVPLDPSSTLNIEKLKIRLTNYPQTEHLPRRPVLMIHGYSVSGTTFAHPNASSLARYLWQRGWDPWIVDLRTSSASWTSRLPWSFEEVAYVDIPLAVAEILKQTGAEQLDVVAHCMGSAMLSMALLEQDSSLPYSDGSRPFDPYGAGQPEPHRIKLKQRIRRIVLSQVTPITLYSPVNVLRGFVLRYLLHYLNLHQFEFRVVKTPSVTDQMLDRVLSSLPYSRNELAMENPFWSFWTRTPWTGTRHRMDLLYGQDFKLENLRKDTLEYIDDLFGPLNIDTESQGIHFSRRMVLTDKLGNARYVTVDRVKQQLKDIPILSIHGEENGLVDVKTANYMKDLYEQAGFASARKRGDNVSPLHLTKVIEGYGHQDCMIGKHAEKDVFRFIHQFLERGDLCR